MPRKPPPAPKKTSRASSPKKKAGSTKTATKASKAAKSTARTSKTTKKTTKSASKSAAPKSAAKLNRKPTKVTPSKKPGPKAEPKSVAKTGHSTPERKSGKPVPTPGTKPAPKGKTPAPAPAASEAQGKRKGISIVGGKGAKSGGRKGSGSSISSNPHRSQLLGPNAPKRAPLIPSGPGAASANSALDDGSRKPTKSPFRKRELDKFREVLLQKRSALIGDISTLEAEALNLGRDERSHTPQHMAEQGSDSAEQTLALGLAAADRKLIREIDDAIKRIDEGRYGLCEMTGRPIRVERLRELPWARYSIDAARELERRSNPGSW